MASKQSPKKAPKAVKSSPKVAKAAKAPAKLAKKKVAAAPAAKKLPKVAAKPAAAKAQPAKAPVKGAAPAVKAPVTPALTKPKGRGRSKTPLTTEQIRMNMIAAGEQVCREVACEGLSSTAGYCRLHYIKNWKKIKRKELILKEKKLNQYIEELVAKYPDKYIEAIRQDLANEKDFAKVINDLDLDEGIDDFDGDQDSDSFVESIRRDFEDEGDF